MTLHNKLNGLSTKCLEQIHKNPHKFKRVLEKYPVDMIEKMVKSQYGIEPVPEDGERNIVDAFNQMFVDANVTNENDDPLMVFTHEDQIIMEYNELMDAVLDNDPQAVRRIIRENATLTIDDYREILDETSDHANEAFYVLHEEYTDSQL